MNNIIQTMKQEMQDVLQDNILRFWLDKMQDQEHGGFYGRIDGSGVLHPEAEKGAILNARILWSFSAAYRVLGNQEYLDAATRAKDYIIERYSSFSAEMGAFAKNAFEKNWIDAEVRAGKVGGAYDEDFALNHESRILTNFTGKKLRQTSRCTARHSKRG